MKIVLLVRSLGIGGAERQLIVLARALAHKHEVAIVIFYDEDGPAFSRDYLGCQLFSLSKQGRWDVVGFAWRYLRLMARFRPQVVYAFLQSATLVSLLSRLVVPSVALVWGVRASRMDYRFYDTLTARARAAEIRLSRCANLLIANSVAGRRDAIVEGVDSKRIIVISNGIDCERYKPCAVTRATARHELGLAENELLIGVVARLDPMKGHEILLGAAAELMRTEAMVRLMCIGSGSRAYAENLKGMAKQLGLEARITWLEASAKIENYYPAMDIHTSASLFGEGFSNALGEAMASGVPCVATAVGDATEIIGDTGVVVAPGSITELAAGWRRLISQIRHERNPGLSALARARIVERYGIQRMVDDTEKALQGVAGRSVGARSVACRSRHTGSIRIAHLISDLDVGGAERVLVRLVDGMRRHYPQLVICMTKGGPLVEEVLSSGVAVVTLNMPHGRPTIYGFLRALETLRKFRPSVLQTWLYHADLLGTLLAPCLGRVQLIWNLRCADMHLGEYRRLTSLVRRALVRLSPRPTAILANSQAAIDAHIGFGYRARRWTVIPNGFDLTRFRPDPAGPVNLRAALSLPCDAKIIGLVARYDPAKDHGTLLSAARIVCAARSDVWFYLVGPGVTALASEVAALGLESRVILSETRTDVERIYVGLDLAVLCSRFGESFPNVLGEAMACATPCITTDVGEARTIVGETGIVVPRSNPLALATAILKAMDWSPAERAAHALAARLRIVELFGLEAVLEKHVNFYDSLSTICTE